MTSSAADKEQPPSYTESSRKRRHVPTPDSEEPSKKARSESNNDTALKLALDHLCVDPPSHPLYQRNVDFIVDHAMNGRRMEHAISKQITRVLRLADFKKDELDDDDLLTLRQQLVLISGRRILNALGAHLDYEFNFEKRTENFKINQDGDGYKLAFTIHPVMRLDGDDAVEQSVKRAKTVSAKASKVEWPVWATSNHMNALRASGTTRVGVTMLMKMMKMRATRVAIRHLMLTEPTLKRRR